MVPSAGYKKNPDCEEKEKLQELKGKRGTTATYDTRKKASVGRYQFVREKKD